MKRIIIFFLLLAVASSAFGIEVYVKEYYRADGTLVRAHERNIDKEPEPLREYEQPNSTVSGNVSHHFGDSAITVITKHKTSYPDYGFDSHGTLHTSPTKVHKTGKDGTLHTPPANVPKVGKADNYTDEKGILRNGKTGNIHRSQTAKHDFKKLNPCPGTGKTTGACAGYVIDHVQALKHGGKDTPENMQWQTIVEGKSKDKWE